MTKEQVSHRQHYVWQKYLEPWIQNNKIWWERNGLLKNTNTNSILFRYDYYKISKLNILEKYILEELFIKDSRKIVDYLNKRFAILLEIIDKLESVSSNTIQKEIGDIRIQAGENMMSEAESLGFEALNLLKSEDFTFFDYDKNDDVMYNFLLFLNYQFFRTKKVRDSIKKRMEPQTIIIKQVLHSNEEIDWEKLMGVGVHFLVNKITFGVLNSEKHFFINILIDNKNRLITSDQPVINTKASADSNVETEALEYYYPISPRIAVLVSNTIDSNKKVVLADNEVERYNKLIALNRHEFLLASTKEILLNSPPH